MSATTAILFVGTDRVLNFVVYGAYFNLALVFALGALCMIALGLLIASRTKSEELAGDW